jgi:hypothetical protein
MLRIIRKHNKWLMVAFGILLIIAFTAPEMIQRIGHAAANRPVATLDGTKIRLNDQGQAHLELVALNQFAPGLLGYLGIEGTDTTHWILLTHEAERAGLIGGAADGREFLTELARFTAEAEMRRDVQLWIRLLQNPEEMEGFVRQIEAFAPQIFAQSRMNQQQMYETLAKLRGTVRLVMMHNQAARFSDRHAIVEARLARDSAIADYVFVPASMLADRVADPTPEELHAHFETFKDTAPGEGEYGIGYLLPPRVRVEWLKVDRATIENAVQLDAVAVRRRHLENRSQFPGEFAEERINVETQMRSELAARAMQTAHAAAQAHVLGATRRLEQQGRFRRVTPDWEPPRMEEIAPAIVEALGREGHQIPHPEVRVLADRWLTAADIRQLDGVGQAFVQRGERRFAVDDVIFSARELGGTGAVLPVQVGIPLVESYLTDWAGNRYYLTILDARRESPPDSIDEIREQLVHDYKVLAAHRQLKERAGELQQLAQREGLEAVPALLPLSGGEMPQVRTTKRIYRDSVDGGDTHLDDPDVRAAIVEAAARIDPLTPAGQVAAEDATVAVASDQNLGLVVARIHAKAPLTVEDYRRTEQQLLNQAQIRELREATEGENVFSLAALLSRYNYVSGGTRIRTPEELRRAEDFDFEG